MPETHDDQPTHDDLHARLAELTEQLEASRQTIAALERRSRIDQLLSEAEPVDFEAARLLTEAAVSRMEEADLSAAVSDLRRHKPYLFKATAGGGRGSGASTAMAPGSDTSGAAGADEAAAHAAATGDRRDLLAYLRRKRGR